MKESNEEQMESIKLRKRLKHEKVAENKKKLDSNLWKKLPHALHDFVFSQLPINEICRLRCLSKTWKYKTPTTPSFFTQKCEEAYPIMLSLITSRLNGNILVRTLDVKRNKWYTHKFEIFGEQIANTGGMGLICSSTISEVDCSPQIYLTNPLTRDLYHLPAIPNEWKLKRRLDWVQKFNNHVVVSMREEDTHSNYTRQYEYDLLKENTKEWTLSQPNIIEITYMHELMSFHNMITQNRAIYPPELVALAYHNQSFFALWRRSSEEDSNIPSITTKFYIKEHHQNTETFSVEGKVHNCEPLEVELQPYDGINNLAFIYACDGYLMIVIITILRDDRLRKESAWLYDLTTCIWTRSDFPGLHFDDPTNREYLLRSKWKLKHSLQDNVG